jgi:hypothetical protein
MGVKTVLASLMVVPMLVACSADHASVAEPRGDEASLSQDEVAKAEAVVRRCDRTTGCLSVERL